MWVGVGDYVAGRQGAVGVSVCVVFTSCSSVCVLVRVGRGVCVPGRGWVCMCSSVCVPMCVFQTSSAWVVCMCSSVCGVYVFQRVCSSVCGVYVFRCVCGVCI